MLLFANDLWHTRMAKGTDLLSILKCFELQRIDSASVLCVQEFLP
jgi:hypothetical protein